MVTKDEAAALLTAFIMMAKTQFEKAVKVMRSDNALELSKSYEILKFFADHGIAHQTSCVQTPQQNGVVKRKHKHFLEVSRALMFQASLPVKYWGECVLTATHLINRMPTRLLKGKTPYEVLHNSPPSYSHLKVFGCLCFMSTTKQGRDKFQPRAKACVFMGYPLGQKGYKVMDLETNKFHVSRYVVFHEGVFPFANMQRKTSSSQTCSSDYSEEVTPVQEHTEVSENQRVENEDAAQGSSSQRQRRSTRTHNRPNYLQDYVCCSSNAQTAQFCFSTLTNMCIPDRRVSEPHGLSTENLVIEP